MLLVCSYQDCMNIRNPCSAITFFSLPKDHRRKIWIRNSGNKSLDNISDTAIRYFCEQHFNPKHIRRQFHRSILHKFAEPYRYIPSTSTVSGIGFSSAGVRLCHRPSKNAISEKNKKYQSKRCDNDHALTPHGLSVVNKTKTSPVEEDIDDEQEIQCVEVSNVEESNPILHNPVEKLTTDNLHQIVSTEFRNNHGHSCVEIDL